MHLAKEYASPNFPVVDNVLWVFTLRDGSLIFAVITLVS